jgi:hypothetical protein
MRKVVVITKERLGQQNCPALLAEVNIMELPDENTVSM